MHPFLGVWGSPRNSVQRSSTAVSTVNFTTSATAYNNATPAQLVASTPFDAGIISLRVNTAISASATRTDTVVELMAGGAGSEYSIVGPVAVGGRALGSRIDLPILIPAGTRLSLRVRSARTSFVSAWSIDLYEAGNRDVVGYPTRWIAYGLVDDTSANAQGTILTPGTSNAWGSWGSITTSTTYAHDLWVPVVDAGTFNAGTTTGVAYRSQFALASTTDAATQATNATVWEGPTMQQNTTENVWDLLASGSSSGPTFYGLGAGPGGIIYAPRASGAAVSARGMCSGTPSTNCFAVSILAAI